MIKKYVLSFSLVGVRVAACILCFAYTVAPIYSMFFDLASSGFGTQPGVEDYVFADFATLFTAAFYFVAFLMIRWLNDVLIREETN